MAAFANGNSARSQTDYVRTASALEIGELEPRAMLSELHYSRLVGTPSRDISVLEASCITEETLIELGSTSRLLQLQTAFWFKMFSIFAIQLLCVWVLVGTALFCPQANDIVEKVFENHDWYIAASITIVLVLLVLLHCIVYKLPLYWFVLLFFSTAQATLFAAAGVVFGTNLAFLNCGATFSCTVIMILLSGVRIRSKDPRNGGKLLSPSLTGLIALMIVALAAGVLFDKFGQDFVTERIWRVARVSVRVHHAALDLRDAVFPRRRMSICHDLHLHRHGATRLAVRACRALGVPLPSSRCRCRRLLLQLQRRLLEAA